LYPYISTIGLLIAYNFNPRITNTACGAITTALLYKPIKPVFKKLLNKAGY
jgi:hypothetical protein